MIGILFDIGRSNTTLESDVMSIDLDIVQEEIHEWTNEVTQFPVETGSPISDHIQPMPDRITIGGIMSNSAIGLDAMNALSGGEDRIQTAFDALLKLKEDRKLVTIYTRFKIYSEMAIKSCNIPRNAQSGDSINFKMELVHIRLVETQTVDVPDGISKKLNKKSGSDVQKKTEPKKDNGTVQPVDKSQSILKGIFK